MELKSHMSSEWTALGKLTSYSVAFPQITTVSISYIPSFPTAYFQLTQKNPQSAGFEPALPEGNRYLVGRLNHSATTASYYGKCVCRKNFCKSYLD